MSRRGATPLANSHYSWAEKDLPTTDRGLTGVYTTSAGLNHKLQESPNSKKIKK